MSAFRDVLTPPCSRCGYVFKPEDRSHVCKGVYAGFRPVTVIDGETRIVGDILTRQLEKSVQQSCKHNRKGIISTSESGSNTCYVLYYCRDCKKSWNDELLPADYQKLLADYQEPE